MAADDGMTMAHFMRHVATTHYKNGDRPCLFLIGTIQRPDESLESFNRLTVNLSLNIKESL